MNDKEVFAFVEAVYGAHFDAVRVFAANAVVGHDIGHEELQDFHAVGRATWNVAPFPWPDWGVDNCSKPHVIRQVECEVSVLMSDFKNKPIAKRGR
jgi:hypothetical protein